jgi:hypothetical protein
VDVIDIDPLKHGFETEAALRDQGKALPNDALALTRSGGKHVYVRHNPLLVTGTNRLGDGIDFRGTGGYVVAPPSQVEGNVYRWAFWSGKDRIPEVPAWIIEGIKEKAARLERERLARATVVLPKLADDQERVRRALEYIDADDRDTWLKIGMALSGTFGEGGRPLWDAWSSQSPKFSEAGQNKAWRSFRRRGRTIGTVFELRRGSRFRIYDLGGAA